MSDSSGSTKPVRVNETLGTLVVIYPPYDRAWLSVLKEVSGGKGRCEDTLTERGGAGLRGTP